MGYAQRRPSPGYMSGSLLALILYFSSSLPAVHSQTTPSSTDVPPLQWINLTGLLGGSNAPPPLKGASLGYDDTNRNLLIYGGESQQGFPVSQTYLLNLETLTWHAPIPAIQQPSPPPRSYPVSGDDFVASNRHSHIVIGGKGADGRPLNDVWEFDYTSQFWSEVKLTPGGPSARWGSVGGLDIRTPPIQDISLPGPNNTFYLAGGFDGTNALPLSDVWRLNISGILTSNNPDAVVGSWEKISTPGALEGKTGMAGTVLRESSDTQQRIVSLGGCPSTYPASTSCLTGNDIIVNADARSDSIPPPCPVPRLEPAVAPNLNSVSTSYGSQVFMLLGTFDSSRYDDDGALKHGEVAVLDVSTRGWDRVLPAGDPGAIPGGKPTYPSPRAGASALSWTQGLVGNNRAHSSDTIVFGGQDETGNYLSEVWILRAYNSRSNGPLTSGVNANGAGVQNQYMTKCATLLEPPSNGSPTTPGPSGPSETSPPGPTTGATTTYPFDVSVVHKALSPVSVAILLPAILAFRLSSPAPAAPASSDHRLGLLYLSILITLTAFGAGIGGLTSAFRSITPTASLIKRPASSNHLHLHTDHGKAGLALFAGLFGVIPLLIVASIWRQRNPEGYDGKGRHRANSGELAEKTGLYPNRPGSPQEEVAQEETQSRTRSWNTLSPWSAMRNARRSSESGFDASSPSTVRSFEVTNRPARARRASANSLAAFGVRPSHTPRSLSDTNWPERPRNLTSTGDDDYAMSSLSRRMDMPPTPGTAVMDIQSTRGLMSPTAHARMPQMPSALEVLARVLLHTFILGLSIVSLVELWSRAPKGAFAGFLVWIVLFYALITYFSYHGTPRYSLLSVILNRITTSPTPAPPTPTPSRPLSHLGLDSVPFPVGPYAHHQPPFRVASEHDYPISSHGGHGSVEDDDDMDEDTRQRTIEEEMNRREVSIVTVPKRKLFLTNPETS
ncbi:hypothetical protein BXZ70DRAFT_405944 [Cristinia sonorae]|uniref:Galactose oxidase n=1 Tax=Cristinia sonorae TaxID=1940300 RepID=A0A8K0UWA2_9AGAR|nr:hypothetical protein BXZ70DRAFT_405944 [Cristinia sonorae]